MVEFCGFAGNSDMYGLGIRAGFYLQWYSSILASWIARSEVSSMRISNLMFIFATFLAMVIQAGRGSIRPIEIYISLLLTFGGYLYIVPLFLWRAVTGFKPQWDPTRYPPVRMGRLFGTLNFALLLAVSGFQLWFWIVGTGNLAFDGCPQYGFLFWRLPLDMRGFVTANVVFHTILLFICLGILALAVTEHFDFWEAKPSVDIPPKRKFVLRIVRTLSNICVATVVMTATELTILWNGISDVDEIASTGQLIPFVVGIEMFVRVLYASWFEETADSNDSAEPITRFPDLAIQEID